MINFTSKIEIKELMDWMDGSVTLKCENELKQTFDIHFVQHTQLHLYESTLIPGRIYIDKTLVEQRSDQETILIHALQTANLKHMRPLEKEILKEKLDYVNSERYLTDQKRI